MHKFKWILRQRLDVYHHRPLLDGKYLNELNSSRIYSPCQKEGFGICDTYTLVPRKLGQAYFNISRHMTVCQHIKPILENKWVCTRMRKDESPWPECIWALNLIKSREIDYENDIEVLGAHVVHVVTRKCNCKNGKAMLPPSKGGICGQDIPDSHVSCTTESDSRRRVPCALQQ